MDFELFAKNIPITDTNRCYFLEEKLKNKKNDYNFSDYNNFVRFNSDEQKANKTIFNYSDLYIDINLSKYQQFNLIEKNRYQKQLSKTWLPNEIQLFGQTWKPRDYGYMNF